MQSDTSQRSFEHLLGEAMEAGLIVVEDRGPVRGAAPTSRSRQHRGPARKGVA